MIAGIILAAGSSSRLGSSKQSLIIEGEALLPRTVRIARQSKLDQIVVVLGAGHEQHSLLIQDQHVAITMNERWDSGIGSSIKKGLDFSLNSLPEISAVLFMVCDQPLLQTHHLDAIIERYIQRPIHIIASRYAGTAGVPALFPKAYFPELLNVDDSHGAKQVLNKHQEQVICIDFENGEIDIDTKDDLQRFLESTKPDQ